MRLVVRKGFSEEAAFELKNWKEPAMERPGGRIFQEDRRAPQQRSQGSGLSGGCSGWRDALVVPLKKARKLVSAEMGLYTVRG